MRLLYVTPSPPFPAHRGSSTRVAQFLHCARLAGWSCRVVHYDRQGLDPPAPAPRDPPVLRVVAPDADTWCPPVLCRTVARVVAAERVDVVVARYTYLAPCLAAARDAGARLCVLDADNAFSLREPAFRAEGLPCDGYRCSPAQEARALDLADLVVAVQAREARYLAALAPHRPVAVFGYAAAPAPLPHRTARQVLFVGSDYLPNVVGVRRFVAGPWGAVRDRVPGARLVVAGTVGRHLTGAGDGVVPLGAVDDLTPLYAAATVVVNPVPLGTGVAIKSAEALAHGKCLVTAPAGVRGLEHLAGAALVVPDAAELGRVVADLLTDPGRVAEFERRARSLAAPTFAPRRAFGPVEAAVHAALAGRTRLGTDDVAVTT